MNKLIAAALFTVVVTLTGCGATESAPAATNDTVSSNLAPPVPTTEAPKPTPDLTGTWVQSNPNGKDSYQQATITGDVMSIDWVTDGGDTTSVYWVGTMTIPTDATEPYTWTSQRDAAATDTALLASTSDTKEFTYADGIITYKVSGLGTTVTVKLEKK